MLAPVRRNPWNFAGVGGVQLASEHYRIYTTTNNPALLNYLPGFMESARGQYAALTGLDEQARPEAPLSVYVLANRQQWAVLTRRVTAPRQELFLSIESGGYTYGDVCVLWDLGYFATFSVAAHEGMHQFLRRRLSQRLPSWAEEGLCVLAEGFEVAGSTVRFDPQRNPLRMSNLRKAILGGRMRDLEGLLSTQAGENLAAAPRRAPEYYGQLWALMMFIRSDARARAGLKRMIADARAGRIGRTWPSPDAPAASAPGVAVFRHYIDPDLEAFEKRFRAYAKWLARVE